jgi:protein-tyrosine phosphatase
MINRILVLCVGNICRSPMAEGLLKQALQGHEVLSAGLGALVGQPADPHGIAIMRQRGIDITQHRARQVERWMVAAADMVLVMDMEQKRHLELAYPMCRGKVFRLGEHGKYDIADPYRQGLDAFGKSAELIQQGVVAWVRRIQAITDKPRPQSLNLMVSE